MLGANACHQRGVNVCHQHGANALESIVMIITIIFFENLTIKLDFINMIILGIPLTMNVRSMKKQTPFLSPFFYFDSFSIDFSLGTAYIEQQWWRNCTTKSLINKSLILDSPFHMSVTFYSRKRNIEFEFLNTLYASNIILLHFNLSFSCTQSCSEFQENL